MVHLPGVVEKKALKSLDTARRESEPPAAVDEVEAKDPLEILKAKLELSDLVKQELKSVIRAQHTKIEEYRKEVAHLKKFMSLKERAAAGEMRKEDERRATVGLSQPAGGAEAQEPGPFSKVQLHLLEDMRQEVSRSRVEHGELEAQVRRLRNVVADLKSRNSTLKKASQRYADMLSQLGVADATQSRLQIPGLHTPRSLTRSSEAVTETSGDELVTPVSARSARLSKSNTATSLDERFFSDRSDDSSRSPVRSTTTTSSPRRGTGRRPLSAMVDTELATPKHSPRRSVGPRASLVIRRNRTAKDAMGFWHEESSRNLLHQLLFAVAQVIEDASNPVMLFVADPWLHRTMEERHGGADGEDRSGGMGCKQMLPTTFYLSGKVAVYGYRRGGLKAEPPRFSDLASLPIQGRGQVLALPLQGGPGQPALAVLQATSLAPTCGAEAAGSCNALALSDSQLVSIQLLCATAGGILGMRRQVESRKAVSTRVLGILDVVGAVHSASTVSDFEQIAKLSMTSFFNVVSTRITFYSPASRELLLTATRSYRRGESPKSELPAMLGIGRRNITRISIQDGVVGRCVRKRQVFHLDPIMQSPFVSHAADGIDIDGEKGLMNMLAGPMVADLGEGTSRVVGVLQLIQKRPRRDTDPLELELPVAAASAEGKDKSARRPGCDPFTQEDENLFAEMLKVLGLATYRSMQVQSRLEMEEPSGQRSEPSIEKLLGAV